jgi:hypothetical protein
MTLTNDLPEVSDADRLAAQRVEIEEDSINNAMEQ